MKAINKVIIPLLILLTLLLLAGCDNQKAIEKAIEEEEERILNFMDTYDAVRDCPLLEKIGSAEPGISLNTILKTINGMY